MKKEKKFLLVFMGFLYSPTEINWKTRYAIVASKRNIERDTHQAIYNIDNFKSPEEFSDFVKNGVKYSQLDLSVLEDPINVAYLTAFLCLSMDPDYKLSYNLSQCQFRLLWEAIFSEKEKDNLKPYCEEIFLSSLYPSNKCIKHFFTNGHSFDQNNTYIMSILKSLNPKIFNKKVYNSFDKNVNPLSLVEIKDQSYHRFLLFTLCMFFAEKKLDENLFYKMKKFENSQGYQTFLKIFNNDFSEKESWKGFEYILQQMKPILEVILSRDYSTDFLC